MSHELSTTTARNFKHLTAFQRGEIQVLLREGLSKTQIAQTIGIAALRSMRSSNAYSRTVEQMNADLIKLHEYFADTGQLVYEEHRKACRNPYQVDAASDFRRHIESAVLEDKLSPDAVCGRAKLTDAFVVTVCTKTVYNCIDLRIIRIKSIDLPLYVKRNNKHHHCRQNRRILGESIENRPDAVNERQESRHWEIDTVVGQRTAGEVLLTLDERMTRRRYILKISGKTKAAVAAGLDLLRQEYGTNFSKVFKIITSDNGSEFSALSLPSAKAASISLIRTPPANEARTRSKIHW